jgi:hypothetical protein
VLRDWALFDVTEENEGRFIDVEKRHLRPHQIEGINSVIDRLSTGSGVLLGDEMVINFEDI